MATDICGAGPADILLPAVENSIVPAVLIDRDDRVVLFNAAATAFWGHGREEVLGRSIWPLLPEDMRDEFESWIGDDTAATSWSREMTLHLKDGRRMRTIARISRAGGNGGGHLLLLRDISDEMEAEARNRLLRMAVDTTDQPVLILNAQRRIVYVNRAFTALLGYAPDEAMGRNPTNLLPSPSVSGQELEHHRGRPWGREAVQARMLVRRKDGHDLWVRIQSSPAGAEARDEMHGYSVDVLSDITQEQQIRELERDVLEALTSNLSFEELGNYLCYRIQAIAPGVLASVCRIAERRMRPWAAPDFPPEYGAFFDGIEIGEGVASCGTAAHRGKPVMVYDIATDPLWAPYKQVLIPHGFRSCWTFPLKRRDGSVAGTFAFYFKRDGEPDPYLERIASASVHLCALAIEREENRQKTARLAQFDGLTGLPNLNHLNSHVEQLLAAQPAGGVAFFCLGLDRFTDINASLGAAVGDRALMVMANRLQANLRPGEFLGRAESDQFVIVAPGLDANRASASAEHLNEVVGGQIELDGHLLSLSTSVGISLYPEGGGDRDTLLANAKSAMRRVKENGGGDYEFFSPDLNRMAQDRLLLGAALRRAIEGDRLNLHYQPQVRTDTGEVCGLEALARWHDAEFGHIPPGRFIPLAEETGQIAAIGRWALREACRQLAQWQRAGVPAPTVSVNLSPVDFGNHDLPDYVAGVLREFGLSGGRLTIEITESAMMALTDEALGVVNSIRALGVGLSVDDFGTGFSGLSNLVNLPVTEVKIDRSFIVKSLEDVRVRALVAAVVGLGHSLGLTVVAEGVETEEQRSLLQELSCPVIQGYLFSPPLKPEAVPDWLRRVPAAGAVAATGT
ncbi:oxygen-sensing cyclic-di-GMP phosphodiesterase DosP [Xanthobacter sediminis]